GVLEAVDGDDLASIFRLELSFRPAPRAAKVRHWRTLLSGPSCSRRHGQRRYHYRKPWAREMRRQSGQIHRWTMREGSPWSGGRALVGSRFFFWEMAQPKASRGESRAGGHPPLEERGLTPPAPPPRSANGRSTGSARRTISHSATVTTTKTRPGAH